jgi:peptidoglycan/xylan/chitin deacetylase (PgdA/CDA1 family)
MRRLTIALALLLVLPGVAVATRHAAKPRFLEPSHGDALRGRISVSVEGDPLATSMRFDWSRDGGRGWKRLGLDRDGFDGFTVLWDSRGYTGAALIRATDSLGGQTHIRVRIDNTAPVVSLRATPAFSPNEDGTKDLAGVRVTADEPAALTLQVVGPAGRVVWTAARDVAVEAGVERRYLWNGRIWDGTRRGRDGTYSMRSIAVDTLGNRSVASAEVVVDTKPPVVAWQSLTPERLASGPVSLALDVADASGAIFTAPAIYAEGVEKPAQTFRGRWWRSAEVAFAVTPAATLPTGNYAVAVSVKDAVGNSAVSERRPFLLQRSTAARVWARFDGVGKRVALTFDDCYEPGAWGSILDTLKRYAVKATFFCPGRAVQGSPALALRTVREGHAIGSHGWDHADFSRLSYGSALQRLVDDREVWWNLAHVSPLPLFRPPYGSYNSTTVAAAGAAGYSALILWTVDPYDWKNPGPSTVVARVVGATFPGSIDLMHTVGGTAIALPTIIEQLRAQGYEMLTIPQLAAIGTPDNAHWPNF